MKQELIELFENVPEWARAQMVALVQFAIRLNERVESEQLARLANK